MLKIKSLLLLSPVLILWLCMSTSLMAQSDPTTQNTVPALPKYQKGESYKLTHRMEELMDAKGSPMGDWTMDNKIDQMWSFSIRKVDKKGFSYHEGTLDHIVIKTDMGEQGRMEYDTKKPPMNDMHKHFASLIGMEVKLKINEAGDIVEVEGAEALQGHIFRKDAAYNGNHHLAESWNLFNMYPDKEVADGESWSKKRSVSSFYPFEADFLCAVSDTPAVSGDIIMTTAFVNPNPNSIPTNEMGMKIDYEFKGAASGFFIVDNARQRIARGDTNWDLEGNCKMALPDGTNTEFPVTLKKTSVLIYEFAAN